MENYPKIFLVSVMSENRHNLSLLMFLVTLFGFRVLMSYHAELNLGVRWSVCTLQATVLLRHYPRNFISDKLAINLFSFYNLLFIS